MLPVELKSGRLDLWPVFATAFAANTGLLANLDSEAVTPTDLAAIVRVGFISAGSDTKDAETLLMKAIEVLRAVRVATAEAYAKARPPSSDIDAAGIDTAGIIAECDDTPDDAPRRRGRPRRKRDEDKEDQTDDRTASP